MFDKAIVRTDAFVDMPPTSQNLYFHLGLEADDEGFVSPQMIMRTIGCMADDLKILSVKGFVIPFKTGVVVITDFNQNNWLDNRRVKPTQYQDEKKQLTLTGNNKYVLSNRLATAKPEERSGEESRGEQNNLKTTDKSVEEPESPSKKTDGVEVNEVIGKFKDVNPSYGKFYSIKTQRSAVSRLLKVFPPAKLSEIIALLPQVNGQQFAPTITTPLQLEDKMASLMAFVKRSEGKKSNMIVI